MNFKSQNNQKRLLRSFSESDAGLSTLAILLGAALVIAVAIASGSFLYHAKINAIPGNDFSPKTACTQESRECPDGSYVIRTGPNCEFASCFKPLESKILSCTSDSDCPSPAYTCQALESSGTVYPNNEKPPETIITKGECKVRETNRCTTSNDCSFGLLCHENVCTNPIGKMCAGLNDTSCSFGYTCVQSCGPPVARDGDPPAPYFCELNESASKPKICPICLASKTKISSPNGDINVEDIKVGDKIWSVNSNEEKIESMVIKISSMNAPKSHKVVHLVLSSGREVFISPNHPTINGLVVGELRAGDFYDGSIVESVKRVFYWAEKTYDILPNSDTGYYFAGGILLKSTLK